MVDSTDNLVIDALGYQKSQVVIPNVNNFQIGLEKLKKDDSLVVAYFPGGVYKFYDYISNNLRIPKNSRGVSGKVFVEFVIDSTGHILPEDVKVLRGLSASCDAEALRVVKECPPWVPASRGNKRVRQKMILPVGFNLRSEN